MQMFSCWSWDLGFQTAVKGVAADAVGVWKNHNVTDKQDKVMLTLCMLLFYFCSGPFVNLNLF